MRAASTVDTTTTRPWRGRLSRLTAVTLIASGLVLPPAGVSVAEEPDTTAPVATITAPAADPAVQVAVGASLLAEFACEDPVVEGQATSGIAADGGCVGVVAEAGAPPEAEPLATVATGDPLPTATPGSFELRVTATDGAGLSGSTAVGYVVDAPPADTTAPVVTITSPAADATLAVGESVLADYACSDEEGGSGIATCTGPVASGSPIDTTTAGTFTFTVAATDAAGNAGSASVTYTVTAPPPLGAAQVTGVVRDEDGDPIAGAIVKATPSGGSEPLTTSTNTGGTYSMVLLEGSYDFVVTGPMGTNLRAERRGVALAAGSNTVDWVLDDGLSRVSGRVVWDGVAQSYVYGSVYCPGSASTSQAASQPDGTFSANVVAQAGCRLTLSTMNAGSIEIPIDATTDLDLGTLNVPYSTVTVHVRTATGDPVAGVSVNLSGANDPYTMGTLTSTIDLGNGLTGTARTSTLFATTNTSGTAQLKVIGAPTGQAKITTSGAGTPSTTTTFTLTGTTTELTLFLGGASGGYVSPGAPGTNVAPEVEVQVPSAPSSTLPTGDGNGDNVADAQQENVASVPTFGGDPVEQSFITLAAPTGTVLTNVFTIDPVDTTDDIPALPTEWKAADVTLPEGLTRFKALNVAPGGDLTLSVFTESTGGVTGYAKYDARRAEEPLRGWYLLPTERVKVVSTREVRIRLTDGGIGDADGLANGIIDDPGGLVEAEDTAAPSVSIAGPQDGARYQPGQVPEATCSATDDISLAGPCTVTLAGPANGLGEFTVTATATDWAGNTGQATLAYVVSATTYRIDGFAQPINDPALVPAAPMSVFKAGSTIPVKFQLWNEDGSLATPASAPEFTWVLAPGTTSSAVNEPTTSVTATSGQVFRYEDGWWHYNWKTAKADLNKRFLIGAALDDGTTHTVVIGLR